MSELTDFDEHYHSKDWLKVAESIVEDIDYHGQTLSRAGGTDHVVFFVGDLVLKIYRPDRNCFERERYALEFAASCSRFATPEIVLTGNRNGLDYLFVTKIRGNEITRQEFLALCRGDQIDILSELAIGLTELHEAPVGFDPDWREFVEERAVTFIERQIERGVNLKIIDQLPQYIAESLPLVPFEPAVFLHGDVHFGNLRFVRKNGRPAISGLFDFADSRVGWHEYDILAICVLMIQGERELQREFFRAYGCADADMNEEMRRRLMMLTMLYETSDLRRYALRLRPDAVDLDVYELEKAIWAFV